MIDDKYYGKKIKLTQSLEADVVLIDVTKDNNPIDRFIVVIGSGQEIIIMKPLNVALRTSYYPKNGFLFDVVGTEITGHIGSRGSGNTKIFYEVQFASEEFLKQITE